MRLPIHTAFVLVSLSNVTPAQDVPASSVPGRGGAGIDLSEGQVEMVEDYSSLHVLARDWVENFRLSGFGAFAFIDSGSAGTRPQGGFMIKETSLFLEAEVWEDMSFLFELQVNRLGKDDSLFVRTGEVFARFDEVLWPGTDHAVGVKLGRVDLPFGEEYLWQDAPDNPLITQSAPYPYGFDEGVVLFGGLGPDSDWIFSLTDGTDTRSTEDDVAKAATLKASHRFNEELYLSASGMINGNAAKSAFEFGGSHFEPVGASHPSTAGVSASTEVDAHLWELDGTFSPCEDFDLSFFYGHARVEDKDSTFNRDMRWFMVQPLVRLSEKTHAAIRYSEIGTYDSSEGYHFDGKILAGGNAAFGYDTRTLQRLSAGVGWQPNPRALFKVEVGKDWFDLIDGSPFNTENSERLYFGVEVVLSF